MQSRIAEVVLKDCLGCRPGETVLVVTDTKMEAAAWGFREAALSLGLDCSAVSMPPRGTHGEEPTPAVAAAMKACDAAVLLTTWSLTHTVARRAASDECGVRIASMPGVDLRRLPALLDLDYDALAARCEAVAARIEGGRAVRLRSDAGTDLSFEIAGRTVYRDNGRILERGRFGNLPAGEVCLAPLEGTAHGVLVVDGSLASSGLVTTPVTLRFENGRAVEVSDPALRELLASHGEDAFCLAEFGIGTNPRARLTGSVIEDEKAVGTAHVAVGANQSMGGAIQVPVHIDMILRRARVEVDGAPVPEEFLTPPEDGGPAGDGAPLLEEDAQTYRTLFEHSNEPSYILDIETQRFVLVNAAFERLTGYDRAELLSGKITAQDIVARESRTTYVRKRETRREVSSERYDLKVQCKTGGTKPVEISVKRLPLGDREMVIGTIHDLSLRKKLELEMWDKIEELSRANARIFSLTEKIRRVPDFTPALLDITDEHELLDRASHLLCNRHGLAYAAVTFYLARASGELELAYSTAHPEKEHHKLPPEHNLVRILRSAAPPVLNEEVAILPLKGRERNLGVIEVAFHPKEIELLRDNDRAIKGYNDLLEAVSNMLGLLIENLHLYEQVRRQATTDALTGAHNRRYFDAKIKEELIRARRYGRDLSLLMVDLDRFKEINDSFDHRQGDAVLVDCVRLLRAHTRDVDLVCRYGGDEFAVLMPETRYEGALAKAEALREAAAAHAYANVFGDERPVRTTLSIGAASLGADAESPDDLIRQADEALFEAKRSGRDRVVGALAEKRKKKTKRKVQK